MLMVVVSRKDPRRPNIWQISGSLTPNNNLNYGWGNIQGQGSNENLPPPPRKSSQMEETLAQFIKMRQGNFEAMKTSQETSNKNHEASIKNLEVQMGQLSKQFSSLQSGGSFGGNTQDNPKNESCKAINLRNRVVSSLKVRENSKKNESKKGSEGEVEKVREGVEKEQNGVVENERKSEIE
ncbi:hypothetical protein A2U01_0011609, partial [Trifolium medium]|nr:hypothetical protein [Trifolium medium]